MQDTLITLQKGNFHRVEENIVLLWSSYLHRDCQT